MDAAFKVYAPDSLEKGCPPGQPLHPEPCHTSSSLSEQTRRRSLIRHLWIALVTVTLAWLVFGQHTFYDLFLARLWKDDEVGWSRPPPAGNVHDCMGGTNWTTRYDPPPWTSAYPYGAEIKFSLPLDSAALFLVSRGPFQQGEVNIEQSTQVGDSVDVRVRVAYFDEKHLERATVRQLERGEKEHGVGIFTPPRPPHWPYHGPRHELEFDVTVTLPATNDGPLSMRKFETKLPNYSQNVADLGGSVLFDDLSLTSINGNLVVESITSKVGKFSSLNGKIDGHFSALSSLDLHVANGDITPEVNLLHREGADPSSVSLHVINGKINAVIALSSDAQTGGEFEVDAQANHGKVGVKFTDSPVDSVLRCGAGTTTGDAQVELHSAFEGTYSLENVLGRKLVVQHDVEDPAGKGRSRVVSVHETRGQVQGELRWVESDGSNSGIKGHVIVKSVMSPVKLLV